jgi:hypothetical protein
MLFKYYFSVFMRNPHLAFEKVSSTRSKSGQIWFAEPHSILSKASISENVHITNAF